MKPNRGSALTLLSSLSHYIYSATAASPLVDLGYTGVQGVRNDSTGVDSFLGIPYAVAPVGDLRWRAPVPIELGNSASFGKALNATTQGPQCVQGQPVWISALSAVYGDTASFAAPLSSSEDCLILDVFAPSNATGQNLPVLLWIHGGGYAVGNAANAGGPNFVSSSNGSVIFVSIQYRLGAYGFLASDAVAEDGTPNAALLDQRAALDWVQRHISAFGGDPSKVTIWGGSAGGGSVTAQLILNGGEEHPPFRAAIPEYPWWQSYKNQSTLNSQYTDLLAASNCSDLTCLRSLPYENLVNASLSTYQTGYEDGKYAYGDFYYGPAVDGVTIRDYPQREIEAGHFSKVALLTDHSAFEGVAFTNFSTSTWNETVDNLKVLWPEAGATFFDRVQQLYPLSDFSGAYFDNPFFSSQTVDGIESRLNFSIRTNSEYWRAQQIYGDYIINCPTYYQAGAFSEHGLPVYKLVFNAGNEIHGAPQSFFQLAPSETPTPDLARAMLGYWTSFTATLDPNAISYSNVSRAVWPPYTGGNQSDFRVLEIYPTSDQVRSDSDANAKCDFLYGRSRVVYN